MPEPVAVARPLTHDSATKHVAGEAVYVDDIPEPARCLEIYIAWAERAHASLTSIDRHRNAPLPAVIEIPSGNLLHQADK